MNMMDF
jgi:hypothetical protein